MKNHSGRILGKKKTVKKQRIISVKNKPRIAIDLSVLNPESRREILKAIREQESE